MLGRHSTHTMVTRHKHRDSLGSSDADPFCSHIYLPGSQSDPVTRPKSSTAQTHNATHARN